ncbi:MFS transporter [Rhizobium lusitanum]|uniref:MFS transporter n=1 Tax=Rhizobium lusitanum TaxID=293958 RepID=UPI001573D6CF|nr:MFS transporter [Rhizobium lusitanum]NTJ11549.1 MFS transporter [Rhizobium lusitanum]
MEVDDKEYANCKGNAQSAEADVAESIPRRIEERATRPTEAKPADSINRTAILAIILISYVMIVLDTSIVITGLPKIHEALGFSDSGLSWVSNAYTLTFGGLLLLGARAGDILGRRRMFIIGLALFVAASLAIGLAQTPFSMIAARAIQGIGAAILAPSTLALLQINFPAGPQRTRAVAYYASAAGLSASFGLVIGGLLADWLSWRVGFFINLPIGIGLILAARRFIVETERRSGKFDVLGALTSTVGMSTLVFGVVNSAAAGWTDPLTIEALILALLLLMLFVFTEWRAKHPIMPLRLFASRERSAAYAARALFLGANIGFFFFSTQFMQGVGGFSSAMTGIAFLPAMLLNFVTALFIPKLVSRFGNGRMLAVSMSINLIGILWLSRVSIETTYLGGLAVPMSLIGIGQGGALAPLTTAGIAGVAVEDAGAASGLLNAAHQLGSSIGLGVLIAVSAFGTASLSGQALLTHHVEYAMTAAAVMLVLALLIVFSFIVVARPIRSNAVDGETKATGTLVKE